MNRRDLFKLLPGAGVAAAALPGVAEAKPEGFNVSELRKARELLKSLEPDGSMWFSTETYGPKRLVLLDIGREDIAWAEGNFTRIWDTSGDGFPTKWMAGMAKTAWEQGRPVRLTAPYLLTMACYEAEAFEVDLIWERCREIGLVDPNGRVPNINISGGGITLGMRSWETEHEQQNH